MIEEVFDYEQVIIEPKNKVKNGSHSLSPYFGFWFPKCFVRISLRKHKLLPQLFSLGIIEFSQYFVYDNLHLLIT
jgi:hypothetical protein